MPETIIEKFKKNIPFQWKVCFVFALIVGLIAHIYKLTNWLPNWDSLVFRYDPQNMIAMGRWFLPVVCTPSSFYDLPWISGLLALIFHGLGAVCICKTFKIERNVTAALIGAATITFPTVTSVLMYNYVADGYAIAFFLSCLAATLMIDKKPKYIFSIICIALSSGIYQAYITVTIMILLCYLVIETLNKDSQPTKIIIKTFKFLATGIFGMALYYLILTVILKITNTSLLEYQGINNAMSISEINVFSSLYTIKHSFTDYFFDFSNGISVFTVLNCVIFAVTLILYVVQAITQRTSPIKLALIAFYAILLPIGASVLALINSGVDYHNLMKMGFFIFYLFLILQYEKFDFKNIKFNATKAWAILLITTILVFNNVIIANVSYHKLNMAYEKSYGTLIRIADRIEETEGTNECDSILVIGALENSEDYSANLPPDMTGTTDGFILRADDEIVGQSVLCSALNDYCGTNYKFIYGEEKAEISKKIKADNLGTWPASDSIIISDNVIIIKLGNEEQ